MNTAKYLSLFLEEMHENCVTLGRNLVTLEKTPGDTALLQESMRLAHSCKGAAATMEFTKMAEMCHAMEDILSALQTGKMAMSPAIINACLQAVDTLENALQSIARGEAEGTFPVTQSLTALLTSPTPAAAEAGKLMADTGLAQGTQIPYVRVESKKLDQLLDLTGELSLVRTQLLAMSQHAALHSAMAPLMDRFTRLLGELQYQVTQSRLIPLDQVFARFPRMVRDLAQQQGKQVNFTMNGTAIELDKTLVDNLTTPLIHLLRNAVDHGIETPEARVKAGKPAGGTITIDVRRSEGFAIITVEDDGQLITIENLKQAAREKRIADDVIASLQETTILDFLCATSLSTSASVSMTSGRGVGLSAVREKVTALGGQLTLTQANGRKQFTLSLPLQLSLIQAILVESQKKTYALPFLNIDHLLQVPAASVHHTLGRPAIVVEGEDVPLIHLQEVFDAGTALPPSDGQAMLQILIADYGAGRVGLCVDAVLGNEEIMVKPAAEIVKQIRLFSGYTIRADGSVALIIDVPNVIEHHKAMMSGR